MVILTAVLFLLKIILVFTNSNELTLYSGQSNNELEAPSLASKVHTTDFNVEYFLRNATRPVTILIPDPPLQIFFRSTFANANCILYILSKIVPTSEFDCFPDNSITINYFNNPTLYVNIFNPKNTTHAKPYKCIKILSKDTYVFFAMKDNGCDSKQDCFGTWVTLKKSDDCYDFEQNGIKYRTQFDIMSPGYDYDKFVIRPHNSIFFYLAVKKSDVAQLTSFNENTVVSFRFSYSDNVPFVDTESYYYLFNFPFCDMTAKVLNENMCFVNYILEDSICSPRYVNKSYTALLQLVLDDTQIIYRDYIEHGGQVPEGVLASPSYLSTTEKDYKSYRPPFVIKDKHVLNVDYSCNAGIKTVKFSFRSNGLTMMGAYPYGESPATPKIDDYTRFYIRLVEPDNKVDIYKWDNKFVLSSDYIDLSRMLYYNPTLSEHLMIGNITKVTGTSYIYFRMFLKYEYENSSADA